MLLGHEAAVDGHGYPGDERGGVRAQPDHGLGNLGWRAHPADRLKRGELRLDLGVAAADAIDHRRVDHPGQTALTRIPCWAYSSAAVRVSPATPCLVAT